MPDQGGAFTGNHNADILVPAKAPEGFGYPGINERREITDGPAIERDLPVPMRDGAIIRADLYRAESQPGPLPVLVIWSPYGKHSPVTWDMFDGSEVDIARGRLPTPRETAGQGLVLGDLFPSTAEGKGSTEA